MTREEIILAIVIAIMFIVFIGFIIVQADLIGAYERLTKHQDEYIKILEKQNEK